MSQDKTKTVRTAHYRQTFREETEETMRLWMETSGQPWPVEECPAPLWATRQHQAGSGKHRAHKVSRLWVGEEASGGELTPPTFEGEQPRRIILTGGRGWPDLGARRFLDGAGEPETLNTRTEFTRD